MKAAASLLALAASVSAGTVLWTGSFDAYTTSADFDKWSWSSEVGEYQWYIHGASATSTYLALDPSYKNPAASESHGLKLTIDSTSHWNGQTMQRTEIIPQTTANLGTGTLFYHFSISHGSTNVPDSTVEHQILFFESHFTEMKYGVGSSPTSLQWFVSGTSQWSTPWTAGTWFNFAYEINFSGNTVGLWASTGSSPLVKVVNNLATSASTNSEDFHVGVLAFGAATESYFLSGVYVESGTINTSIGTGTGTGTGTTTAPTSSSTGVTTKPVSTTTTKPVTSSTPTTSASGATQTKYGQCGGTGWTGATVCSGSTCTAVSAPYYYQCL